MVEPGQETRKLPTSISPCPIIDAIFDIWFDPIFPPEAIFGFLYKAFERDFPSLENLPGALIPTETRNANPALLYQPSHRMVRENLVLLVGPRNFAVAMRGQYPGWPSLLSQFNETVKRLDELKVMTRPQRFGLRYINFFSGTQMRPWYERE
jgi:uncharacterized protein (TIGR04255 family)